MCGVKIENKNKITTTQNNTMHTHYNHIRSSFNSDRIAACLASKKRKARTASARHYYAQYSGNVVSVRYGRGHIKFERAFDSKIVSAVCREGNLNVELENGANYVFAIETGIQVSVSGLVTVDHQEFNRHLSVAA